MTTLKEAFAITMSLIDELNENGEAETLSNRDFEHRAPGIVAVLLGELYPYSDTYASPTAGKRAICPPIAGFDDALPLDDFLSRSVLPCALAARLMLDENPAVAAYYERRYMELLGKYGTMHAATPEPIADVYGGLRICR
ncbi:MAG: hypothetical protein LBN00_11205 [Oscillospiraceae bacterium]|jgi:hypothetical protein|nr:hypothetical protein [Oscillospiraceae bacterium]